MYHLGILADDMGVGNTCQLIAPIFKNRPSGTEGTILLVVPAGAVDMWKINLAKLKDIRYIEYNGYKKDCLRVEERGGYGVTLSDTHTFQGNTAHTRAEHVISKPLLQGIPGEKPASAAALWEMKWIRSALGLPCTQ